MEMLLTVLVTWLAVNFGLPATDQHPRVEFATAAEMVEIRVLASDPDAVVQTARITDSGHDLQAIYDDRSRTIYLLEGWTGATPAESSVLVHELVHHLQNVAGLGYDCLEAREKPAYHAQEKWLAVFGTSLAHEFEIGPMTLLVRTGCIY